MTNFLSNSLGSFINISCGLGKMYEQHNYVKKRYKSNSQKKAVIGSFSFLTEKVGANMNFFKKGFDNASCEASSLYI
jgi:hypothetical protein